MNGGYKGWNPYIERHLAIFVNYFRLERTNQLNPLPDKDLVDLCPPIEPYQVTKSHDQILENRLDICLILGQFCQCHSLCKSFNFTASA
uniref:Similarity n=1 Tax=Microcystis aeruginosa (strain PCC 7806) TaxID=267872 RepID=A8YKT1_MICA7|nr:unnamed protein product [Microcystis aeruginosa PCC 7806]